jgi:hypothetical protein
MTSLLMLGSVMPASKSVKSALEYTNLLKSHFSDYVCLETNTFHQKLNEV